MIVLMMGYFFHKVSSMFQENPSAKIIGGWKANIQDVPYFARIKYNLSLYEGIKERHCGATIIHRQWLLTAAHCTVEVIERKLPLWIILGVDDLADNENMPKKNDKLPRVDIIFCHPQYSKQVVGQVNKYAQLRNDICLLRTDHLLEFGNYIKKAGLPWDALDQKFIEKSLLLSGYGSVGQGKLSSTLRSTRTKLATHEECESLFNRPDDYELYFRDFDICIKMQTEDMGSACHGDSGGGLIYEDSLTGCPIVIGVVSTGSPYCNESVRFPRVLTYETWIQQAIERFTSPSKTIGRYKYPRRN